MQTRCDTLHPAKCIIQPSSTGGANTPVQKTEVGYMT